MLRAAFLLLAGGFAAQHSRLPLGSDYILPLLVALGLIFFVRSWRWIALAMSGAVLFMVAANGVIAGHLDSRYAGDSMRTVVRVSDFVRFDGSTATLRVTPIDDRRLPASLQVNWYQPAVLPRLGDIWQFELRLRPPYGASNPGGFDTEAWMLRERLQARGYVVPGPRNRLLQSSEPSLVERTRVAIDRRIDEVVADRDAAAVLTAIGVGARHRISREQWTAFELTGTSHLMAISGLHVGLAAGVAFAVMYLLSVVVTRRGNHRTAAVVGGAILATGYALLSGFGVPALRATLMLLLASVAVLLRRPVQSFRLVALAAVVVFIAEPLALMAPGFLLSFGAVLVLLLLARRWQPAAINNFHRLASSFANLLTMQGWLLLGLLPITILLFQRVALVAPLVNLLLVPVYSFLVVPLVLLAVACTALLPAVGAVFLRTAGWLVEQSGQVVGGFAALQLADTRISAVEGPVLVVAVLPLLWVLLPRGFPGRELALLAVVFLLAYSPRSPAPGCLEADVLDVGQGLAVVVQLPRHVLIYDTGPAYRSGGSAAERIVLPFLDRRGIHGADWLVISHGDSDHAGGAGVLIDAVRPGRVFVSEQLPLPGVEQFLCRAGQEWRVDGVRIRVLHPLAATEDNHNDNSCVLELTAGPHKLLLTGDIEAAAEANLIERGVLGDTSVAVVPHHGSLTSSSPALVNVLQPQYAIAAAGFGNRWGLPKARVRARWEGAGAIFLSTATSGAINIGMCADDEHIRLSQYRLQRRRFWHRQPES